MQQGIIQKAKEDVIEVIELRFGKISSEIIDKMKLPAASGRGIKAD